MPDQVHRAALLLLSALVVACASRELAGPSGSKVWVASDVEAADSKVTASLDWSALPGVIAAIDGVPLGNGLDSAKLAPGRHLVEYEYHPAEFGVHPRGTIEVRMVAGHSYEFRSKLCYWCKPRKHAEWIVDTSTSELIWGALPTWPSWYL